MMGSKGKENCLTDISVKLKKKKTGGENKDERRQWTDF